MRLGAFLLLTTLAAAPAGAQGAMTDAAARAFLARQERLWNAGDLEAYFATFTADARFTDRGQSNQGGYIDYGTSTLAQARTTARRLLARSKVRETSRVVRIERAPDGRSARVTTDETTRIETAGKVRLVCAQSVHALRATPAGLRSAGQTDYIRRCPR